MAVYRRYSAIGSCLSMRCRIAHEVTRKPVVQADAAMMGLVERASILCRPRWSVAGTEVGGWYAAAGQRQRQARGAGVLL